MDFFISDDGCVVGDGGGVVVGPTVAGGIFVGGGMLFFAWDTATAFAHGGLRGIGVRAKKKR